ncbi:protease inhibitor I9 family protein [Streptomyces sp. NPDC056224]|uniref:protease inhibitor I9 family protein n=1 Tax=Streptomyces sp. NPDC056224 TaxID=3345750 RepID=UPI0035DB2202
MANRLSRALPVAVAVAVAALAAVTVPEPVPRAAPVAPVAHAEQADHATYIVTVRRDLDPAEVAQMVGVTPVHVFRTALHGFAARLSPGQVAALHAMPGVEAIEEDGGASSFGAGV